ncbi:MAG TPA: LamG-like jellyroll fold domain-containing protein, partial [Rhodothermales bacterium]
MEFWTSRASNGTDDFVVNLESVPQGNPTNVDLEIGYNSLNQLTVAFGGNVLASAGAYTDSDWHHVALAYDAPSRRRRLYRDGVQVATDVYTQNYTPSGNLEFGRREDGGNVNNRGHYHGAVDELRLWNTVLGQAQIESLMGGLVTGSPASLVNHWPMDVVAGIAVPDVVGTQTGMIMNPGPGPNWSPTGIPGYHVQIGADLTAYADRATVPNFQSYAYEIAAFEDIDGDGIYTPGVDFESVIVPETMDMGWRAGLAPPGDVLATDGQFDDRVRVEWTDRSDSEISFIVYRDGGMVASVPADTEQYDDFGAIGMHEYCVASSNGIASLQVCDMGRVGGLAPPDEVMATNGTFDDRVQITWSDTSGTEDGFEIFRDGAPIGATGANAEQFSDFTALQEVAYSYCVRSFSNADPANPSTSTQTCAPGQGLRAAVLPPEGVSATDNDFEDRVEISWTNPSTTAMLFRVYREGALMDVLSAATLMATDVGDTPPFESDVAYEYCVAAETVVPELTPAAQELAAQVIDRIRYEDAVRMETEGGEPTAPEAILAVVHESLGLDALGKTGGIAAGVESAQVCDMGSRLLKAPTAVDATDDEFESHVRITWEDNSTTNHGYRIFRDGAPPVELVGGERTTYEDYTGTSGVQFDYTVRAFDDFDTSDPDSDLGKRTLKPPTRLEASDGTSETVVELEWDDNSGAEKGYIVYRRATGVPGVPTALGETGSNEPAFSDSLMSSGGVLGIPYDYFVAAFDDFGESSSASDIGQTRLEAPANVNASDVYFDRIVIIWVDRSGVEGAYRLTRRRVGLQAFDSVMDLPAGTTMHTDMGGSLQAGTEYEYCVTALRSSQGSDTVCDSGIQLAEATPPAPGQIAIKFQAVASDLRRPLKFGASVAIAEANAVLGPNALIGAPEPHPLFAFNEKGLVNRYFPLWSLHSTWVASAFENLHADFGYAVDIDSAIAVVGAPILNLPNEGSFSVWFRNEITGNYFPFIRAHETTAGGDNTGISVAVSDSFIVVGANLRDLPGKGGHGGAIVCNVAAARRNNEQCLRSEGVPELENILLEAQRKADAEFGSAVDITRVADSIFVIVGAPGADRAFIFKCDHDSTDCGSDSDWTVAAQLNTRFSPNRQFGGAVAINENLAVVGAPGAEAIVLYERTNGDWEEEAFFAPPSPGDFNGFGSAVAVRDTMIIVGAPNEEIAGLDDAGAVYVLEWDLTSDEFSEPVRYDARVAGDIPGNPGAIVEDALFGASVDLGGGHYLIGAPGDRSIIDISTPAGAAYAIPFGLAPPNDPIFPSNVTIVTPGNIRASDGTAPDRIQIRWDDE